jgi:hypothetical protein
VEEVAVMPLGLGLARTDRRLFRLPAVGRNQGALTDRLIYLKDPYLRSGLLFSPKLVSIATHQEARNMHDFRRVMTSAFLALTAWTATVNPSRADTGTLRVLFGTAAVVAGAGNGNGILTFHGKTYPFGISGASFGATLTLTVSEFEGRALNLRTPSDLAGNYIAVGAGGAIVGGLGVARLRNANGVILRLRGPKLGAGLSINLARVTITMM